MGKFWASEDTSLQLGPLYYSHIWAQQNKYKQNNHKSNESIIKKVEPTIWSLYICVGNNYWCWEDPLRPMSQFIELIDGTEHVIIATWNTTSIIYVRFSTLTPLAPLNLNFKHVDVLPSSIVPLQYAAPEMAATKLVGPPPSVLSELSPLQWECLLVRFE